MKITFDPIMRSMMKKIPLGISDFKKLIEGGYLYVDKTLFIQELFDEGSDVCLIPRMRRFGKTLNLSMLRYFFEKGTQDTSHLFTSLKIWQHEKYRALQGQFPVIFISLKDVKFLEWQECYGALQELIIEEFERHKYLLDSNLFSEMEKKEHLTILQKEGSLSLYTRSLYLLTHWLHRFHGKRVILLIDEYDTPVHSAYMGGYYNLLISFIRNWFSSALKDNSSLERGVLTGILRIAKESIFSGLNNVITYTILSKDFQDKFGLTEPEVKKLLEDYGLSESQAEIQQWYNGYRIGSHDGIYNPWSVLNCIKYNGALEPYWVNTSDNAIMKELITEGGEELKTDIEELIRGGVIAKKIDEGFVFSDLEKSPGAVWCLLLFSGYLTLDATPSYGTPCLLRIPNIEVKELYDSMILDWFEKKHP